MEKSLFIVVGHRWTNKRQKVQTDRATAMLSDRQQQDATLYQDKCPQTDYRDGKTGIKRSHCDNNNKTQLAYYCNHFLKWGQSMKQKYPLSKQQMIVINNWWAVTRGWLNMTNITSFTHGCFFFPSFFLFFWEGGVGGEEIDQWCKPIWLILGHVFLAFGLGVTDIQHLDIAEPGVHKACGGGRHGKKSRTPLQPDLSHNL